MFDWLTESQAGFDQFFHDWRGGAAGEARALQSPQAALYAQPQFTPIRDGLAARASAEVGAHPYWARPIPVSLVIEEVEALWEPIAARDDWSRFEAKLSDIAELKQALA